MLTYLEPLDKEALRNILTEPKNALVKQYAKLLKMDNVALTFEPEMLDYIVEKAFEYKLGARGLRGLMEMVMTDLMFEMPDNKQANEEHSFLVTKQYAMDKIEKADLQKLKNAL